MEAVLDRMLRLVAIPLILVTAGSAKGWETIDLVGIGVVFVDVPPGVAVLSKGGLEELQYDVRRPKGGSIIRIIERPEFPNEVDRRRAPYCVNGLRGTSVTVDGFRRIVLRLPPAGHEYQFSFEFNARDRTAAAIMQTFRVKNYASAC